MANGLHTAERVDSHNRGVAFHWHDQHFWLYESTSWCTGTASSDVRSPAAVKLPCNKTAEVPPVSDWGTLHTVKAGHYGSEDLEATRQWLWEQGVVCRPSLDHRGKIVRLRAACDNGSCVVLPLNERGAEIEAFLEPYCRYKGQS